MMRYHDTRFLTLLAVLTFAGFSSHPAAGQATAPKNPLVGKPAPAKKPAAVLKYHMTAEPIYAGTVQDISDNVLRSQPVGPGGPGPAARGSVTEGLYLVVSFPDLMAPLQDAVICRVKVQEVGEGGVLSMEIDEEAAERIKPGSGLFMFRPVGSTTALLQAAPGMAPLSMAGPAGEDQDGAGEAAMRTLSMNNLKQIGLAMHTFLDSYRKFPPAVIFGPDGKPWHSWRVLILPFLDQPTLYNQYKFDEPWDGPNNKKLIAKMPEVYSDPIHGKNKESFTHYAALTGEGMAFPAKGFEFDGTQDGIIKPLVMGNGASGIQSFTDGLSNSLLIGTIGPERKIPWTKPEDIIVTAKLPGLGKKGGFAAPYASGDRKAGLFLFGDGHVQPLRDDVSAESFIKLATIGGGEVIGPDDMPGAEAPALASRQVPVIEIRPGKNGPTAHLVMESVAEQDTLPELEQPVREQPALPKSPAPANRP